MVVAYNVLFKDILKRRNAVELTAEELARLEQDILVLKEAASAYSMVESNRIKLVGIKGWSMSVSSRIIISLVASVHDVTNKIHCVQ